MHLLGMKSSTGVLIFVLPLTVLAGKRAAAIYSTSPSAIIPWAPTVPHSIDQSIIYNNSYYLADRSNRGIHVIDITTNTQTALIIGNFTLGLTNGTIDNDISGPNGLIVLPDRQELYAGNGDGTVKVIDIKTNEVIYTYANISTKRSDEFAYDPIHSLVAVTSPAEDTPYVTIISATNRTILGRILFPNATELDQVVYNPSDGLFYVAVPSIPGTPAETGSISVFSASNFSIVSSILTPQCFPFGIIFGPPNHLFVGCGPPQGSIPGYAACYVVDVTSGSIIGNITGVGGVDQVAYSPATNAFYAAAVALHRGHVSTPLLAVISAIDNTLVQTVSTDNTTAHVVAVDAAGDMFVPIGAQGIFKYSLSGAAAGGANASSTAATLSMSASASARGTSAMPASVTKTNGVGKVTESLVALLGTAAFAAALLG